MHGRSAHTLQLLFLDFVIQFFKPGVRWSQAKVPGFLKLILCGLSVCVRACVCVPTHEAINN